MAGGKSVLDKISYTDLYERWEKGNWRAMEIDFTEDKRHWNEVFDETRRRAAMWNYSLFFYGEDSVADNLSPYIDAAPLEEQKYFLTTQQVDEARHAVFFARFFREVIGTGDTIAEGLEATKPELTWGFRKIFNRLDKMADELRKDRSRPQLAAAVTLYHIVVEATLAQPGQHFIDSYLNKEELLPGFRSGMKNVSLDEQRHIGFGVKLLADLIAEDPECKDAMIDLLREVIPWSAGVFVPPNWDRSYVECFGFTLEEIYAEGYKSIETKLRTVGLTDEEIQRAITLPMSLPVEQRVERSVALLQAGVIGEKNGPPSTDPEIMRYIFEALELRVNPRHSPPRPAVIQWDFDDAVPWYLRIDNGTSKAVQGRADNPDLTFACRWEDWTDVARGTADPRQQVLTRKLRPKGSLRLLWRTQKLLG